jgi:hypothetical protein
METINLIFGCLLRSTFFSLERAWACQQIQSRPTSILPPKSSQDAGLSTERVVNNADDGEKSETASTVRQRKPELLTQKVPHTSSTASDGKDSEQKGIYGWPVMSRVPDLIDMYFYVWYIPFHNATSIPYKEFIDQVFLY